MTRVLVVNHDLDMSDIEADTLRRAGYEVDQCRGPIGGDACPVLNGQTCWQVEKAEVLVYDAWASGTGASDLTDSLRDLHPDKPLVVTTAGPQLSWEAATGPHEVTPVAWVASGGDVVEAIEAALTAARAKRPPVRPMPDPAPQKPDLPVGSRW
jgi:DNA-binding NtrC family response regulator